MLTDNWKITTKYHDEDLSNYSFLITGGAGFIGSNLVQYLLDNNAKLVRVLDNMSNGYTKNLSPFENDSRLKVIIGDITDKNTCLEAVNGIDFVSHQAALGSVPRSLQTPLLTHEANSTGFLNMLNASKETGVTSFVYASSSSVYGDNSETVSYTHLTLPTKA